MALGARTTLYGPPCASGQLVSDQQEGRHALVYVKYKVEDARREAEADKVEHLVVHWQGVRPVRKAEEGEHDHHQGGDQHEPLDNLSSS